MNDGCNEYRDQISQSLMEGLSGDQQKALDKHLAECAPCAWEQRLYRDVLSQIRLARDVDVPRHFFVYPDEGRPNLWQVFRGLSLAWKGAVGAAALATLVLCVFIVANLEIRAEPGSYTVRLGKPSQPVPLPQPPAVNLEELKADLLRILEERSRNDKIEIVRTLRSELARSESTLTKRQRLLLGTALVDLESRVNSRVVDTATNLENGTQRSLAVMYRAFETQRTQDLSSINERLSRIAVSGEIKSNQTDAILETLLQVAEFRMK